MTAAVDNPKPMILKIFLFSWIGLAFADLVTARVWACCVLRRVSHEFCVFQFGVLRSIPVSFERSTLANLLRAKHVSIQGRVWFVRDRRLCGCLRAHAVERKGGEEQPCPQRRGAARSDRSCDDGAFWRRPAAAQTRRFNAPTRLAGGSGRARSTESTAGSDAFRSCRAQSLAYANFPPVRRTDGQNER